MFESPGQDAATPATGSAGSAGCVIFLIDETPDMNARVGAGKKSKADSIATAVNSLLNQLSDANLDVAVAGYRGNGRGGVDVGCRWGGSLTGCTFVHTSQLADSPVTVEERMRKVPAPGGIGVARKEPIKFPVWYVPALGGPASSAPGYQYCQSLLTAWLTTPGITPKQPLLISLLGELPDGESLQPGLGGIYQLQCVGGQPLVFHAHLKSTPQVPPILYPATNGHLPPGAIQEIFQWSGYLPEPLAQSLQQFNISVIPGARGMIYNAAMVDLIRFLSMVKAFPAYQPTLPMAPGGEAGVQMESSATVPQFGAPGQETPQATGQAPDQPATQTPAWSTQVPAQPATQVPNPSAALTVDQSAALTSAEPLIQPVIPNTPVPQTTEQPTAPAGQNPLTLVDQNPITPVDQDTIKPRPVVAPVVEQTPQTPATPAGTVALVVLVMDRSVDNPADEDQANVWSRLQGHANDLLGQIAKHGGGKLETAIVLCGADPTGQSDVQTTFAGPLAGTTFAGDAELADGAIRIDQVKEMISNGIGGLIEFNRKKPIYVDLPPTGPAAMSPAYQAAAALVADWGGRHPGSTVPPVILYLGRGIADTNELRQAVPNARLYHLVVTAVPHRSLAYPNQPTGIDDPTLQQLWQLSSPLLGAEALAAGKPIVKPDSRGMVVNGKFDLLLDGILACMPSEPDSSP